MCEHTETIEYRGARNIPSIPIYCRCDCIIPVITEQQGQMLWHQADRTHRKNLSHIVTQSTCVITESTCDKVFEGASAFV